MPSEELLNLLPKITFGIIVLNGEPFLRYNLRTLYPFSHQIIVVEGSSPGAASIATPDGHSTDETLEILSNFKAYEDSHNKLTVITAEDEGHPDGFWPGEKHEMSQAYARRATGDYLWQVDVDEFYKSEDIEIILSILAKNPEFSAVSFKQKQFWGGFSYCVDSLYNRWGGDIYHRLFRWGPGYIYQTHRPPTVLNDKNIDLRQLNWLKASDTSQFGIYLYHYSLVFPKQVLEKSKYYKNAAWTQRNQALKWVQESFMELRKPFRVHNIYDYPSWLERFKGEHPLQISKLIKDINLGNIEIELRNTTDIENLLSSLNYKIGRFLIKKIVLLGRNRYLWGKRQLRRIRILLADPFGVFQRIIFQLWN